MAFIWTARGINQTWRKVASSSDGIKLVATADSDYIYTSIDSGVTWTPRESVRNWYAVSSSSDGTKLVVSEWGNMTVYNSIDSGATWVLQTDLNTNYPVADLASSSDGTKVVAGRDVAAKEVWRSIDGGVTWSDISGNIPGSHIYRYVASSSDGTKIMIAPSNGLI